MLKERLLHPATIIATIALLVALSGVGYAATKIGTAQLKNNAVSTAKIKNGAVSTAKVKNGAVNSAKLASGAVRAADLGAGSVAAAALANDSVTAAKIAGGAVGTNALATGAVDAAKLGNGSVTNEKLGPNAVTGAKIAGGTITAANIENGQVVKGNGGLLSARVVLGATAVNQTVLDLPGIGLIRASCTAGLGSTNFLNQSGSTATVTVSGANAGAVAPSGVPLFQTGSVANTIASTTLPATAAGGAHNWQIDYTDAAGAAHVASASVTIVPLATECVATAQALSTG